MQQRKLGPVDTELEDYLAIARVKLKKTFIVNVPDPKRSSSIPLASDQPAVTGPGTTLIVKS